MWKSLQMSLKACLLLVAKVWSFITYIFKKQIRVVSRALFLTDKSSIFRYRKVSQFINILILFHEQTQDFNLWLRFRELIDKHRDEIEYESTNSTLTFFYFTIGFYIWYFPWKVAWFQLLAPSYYKSCGPPPRPPPCVKNVQTFFLLF